MEIDSPYSDSEIACHLWDCREDPPTCKGLTVLWSSNLSHSRCDVVSLPKIVETNSDALRKDYLAWIYQLGYFEIDGINVLKSLELLPDFSYWWVTSLAQKFNMASSAEHNEAIKILALEKYILKSNIPSSIILTSSNLRLARCLSDYCQRMGIAFKFYKLSSHGVTFRNLFDKLPGVIRGIIFLARYFVRTIFLQIPALDKSIEMRSGVFFFDVLVHLDTKINAKSKFHSNYWTLLGDKLDEWGLDSNWMHIFFSHKDIPTIKKATRLIAKLNENNSNRQTHYLLEKRFSLKIYCKILKNFFKLRRLFSVVKSIVDVRPTGYDVNPWFFHDWAWRDSFLGIQAMDNCLKLELFLDFLKRIPRQSIGFYIAENQPWELFLIYAWRLGLNGKLIGVPHTTIRYWDLRYHYDPRTYKKKPSCNLPMPDKLAINGEGAKFSLLSSGYPESALIYVEALRFLHLLRISEIANKRKGKLTVLICGEFLVEETYRILDCLSEAMPLLSPDIEYILKPHPASEVDLIDYVDLNITLDERPLGELLILCDAVIAGNATSCSVEAFYLGLPLIQILSKDGINTSPLYKKEGVVFFSNSKELIFALKNTKKPKLEQKRFFYLDENLKLWQKLIIGH